MPEKNIAMCGLDCADCPCFLAYQNNDNKLRRKTVERWSVEHNWPGLKLENINCLGCLSLEEPLFKYCKVCEVRKCGLEKRIKNCGECINYNSCGKIVSLHKMIPDGKEICNRINKQKVL